MNYNIKGITFELTNNCNLKCKMCNIWQEKNKYYLNSKDIRKILTNKIIRKDIQSVTLTGGEIFTHPDLDEIYALLLTLKIKKIINSIVLISNGYSSNIINFFNKFEKKHEILKYKNIKIYFSIDGLKQNHNYQRGINSYKKIIKNVIYLSKKYPKLDIGIKYTINSKNIKDIIPIHNFSKRYKLIFDIKPIEFNTKNYYHRNKNKINKKLELNNNQKEEIINIFNMIYNNNKMIDFMNKYIKKEIKNFKCHTPKYYLFINCKGEIYSCLYKHKIGNIQKLDKLNEKLYQKIINLKLCKKPCLAYHGSLKEINFNS